MRFCQKKSWIYNNEHEDESDVCLHKVALSYGLREFYGPVLQELHFVLVREVRKLFLT
jgi:hypothetical protein